jgi:hypothetical protein
MAQLMLCLDIQRHCRQPIDIEGYDIQEWDLKAPRSSAAPSDVIIVDHRTRRWAICRMIDAVKPALVHVNAITFRMGNFCDPALYERYFPTIEGPIMVPDDTLLVHIRAGDVATLTHDRYGPLPVSYYQYLAKFTGMKLAFIGELEETDYIRALKKAFPASDYFEGQSPLEDFQTLRNAANVAIAVSSFSWMATFLSRRAKTIHLPLAGHFDPLAAPESDLLPRADRRVIVHRIPRSTWKMRYLDYVAPAAAYKPARRVDLVALRLLMNAKMAVPTFRIHVGLLRRMIRDWGKNPLFD